MAMRAMLLLGAMCIVCCAVAPTAQTQYGPVRGVRGGTKGGVDIYRSIPYAAPPTGARRFRPPVSPSNWTTAKDVTKQPNQCPQAGLASDLTPLDTVGGDEDCLYLQVYSPSAGGTSPKPVMLWIHGGGFDMGNSWFFGTYDGTRLAQQHDVVVVSIKGVSHVLEASIARVGAWPSGCLGGRLGGWVAGWLLLGVAASQLHVARMGGPAAAVEGGGDRVEQAAF